MTYMRTAWCPSYTLISSSADASCLASAQHGIPKVEDFNRGDNEGSSYFLVNQRRGMRWNTSSAFLRPVMGKRPNLTVATDAHVTRLVLQGERRRGDT